MVYGNNRNAGVFGSRMTRKQFGKAVGAVAGGVAAAGLFGSGVVRATPEPPNENIEVQNNGDIRVYPTGNPDCDVPNVQWAVDNVDHSVEVVEGRSIPIGTVHLKSTNLSGQTTSFNFSGENIFWYTFWGYRYSITMDGNSITIGDSVKIVGDKGPHGNPLTKIEGGASTFTTFGAVKEKNTATRDTVIEIEGIWFDNSCYTSVSIAHGTFRVIGNKITNTRINNNMGSYQATGVMVKEFGLYHTGDLNTMNYFTNALKEVEIAHNMIDLTSNDKNLQRNIGVVCGHVGPDSLLERIHIHDNRITLDNQFTRIHNDGIAIHHNTSLKNAGETSVLIEDNTITGSGHGRGIFVYPYSMRTGEPAVPMHYPYEVSNVTIKNNTLVDMIVGIKLQAKNSTIQGNTLSNVPRGIYLGRCSPDDQTHPCTDVTVQDNVLVIKNELPYTPSFGNFPLEDFPADIFFYWEDSYMITYGIWMFGGSAIGDDCNHTITENTITGEGMWGVRAYNVQDITFSGNHLSGFDALDSQVYLSGSGNTFESSEYGPADLTQVHLTPAKAVARLAGIPDLGAELFFDGVDGQIFTINDGMGKTVTFEIDINNAVEKGNTPVYIDRNAILEKAFDPENPPEDPVLYVAFAISQAIADKINGVGLQVTAYLGLPIAIVHNVPGPQGNEAELTAGPPFFVLSTFSGGIYSEGNVIKNNKFGLVRQGLTAVYCAGTQNEIVGNDHTSTGLNGWHVDMSDKLIQGGCVLLDEGTYGNTVDESLFPVGTVCTQVADLTVYNANPKIVLNNTIVGLESCNLGHYFNLMQKIRQAQNFLERKAQIEKIA